MQQDLAKVYDAKSVEDRLYDYWLERGYFHAEVTTERQPFTIVIPPPNVTDVLHMGHAYNNTIQDIFTRFYRMDEREALYLPGTDHAGIATQNVVERWLRKEKKQSRHDLGREKFVQLVWEWREERGDRIIEQLKKMGFSCDWKRERFTMDEGMSRAVREVFIRLFNKGLIYKGEYIINWCPRCQTALADEEVDHEEKDGNLWHIRYPVDGKTQPILVATTRPETMLGDVAVAVHPNDKRYKQLIGKTATLPLVGRKLPIIADDAVEPEFGTGAVKVTPAHDPNDFLIGQRHNLSAINVMREDASMNDQVPEQFTGMDRLQARKHLVKQLEKEGFLEKVESHRNSVGHCYRCKTVVEPRLSEQWFVKMKPLAEPALEAVSDGRVRLHPIRWKKVFTNWLDNIHDWCISRQIWWGHRIPVFTCNSCNTVVAAHSQPEACETCGKSTFEQETDVLDTWFSSQLWPFATLGWPEDTPELKYFYPTDTLVTAPDIIFFWVARMVMIGMEFMGDVPFSDVYFNGIIRDKQGRKMSKSLGNGIDPLEMVERYSADAVRFSLLDMSSEGQDINLSDRDFELGRNFSNKLWNAFRLLWLQIDKTHLEKASAGFVEKALKEGKLDLSDRWILNRFQKTVRKVTRGLEQFKLHEAHEAIYTFFWREYCDWYLELIKPRFYLTDDQPTRTAALATAVYVMKGILQLLHPIMPFITEEIWQKIRNAKDAESIMVSRWPAESRTQLTGAVEKEMELIQNVIGAVRNIRGEMNVPPHKNAHVVVVEGDAESWKSELLIGCKEYLQHLANVDEITLSPNGGKPKQAASAVVSDLQLYLPLEGLIDFQVEKQRLTKEISRIEKQLEGLNTKLQNNEFLSKAPEDIVELERKKKSDFQSNLTKLKANLESLSA